MYISIEVWQDLCSLQWQHLRLMGQSLSSSLLTSMPREKENFANFIPVIRCSVLKWYISWPPMPHWLELVPKGAKQAGSQRNENNQCLSNTKKHQSFLWSSFLKPIWMLESFYYFSWMLEELYWVPQKYPASNLIWILLDLYFIVSLRSMKCFYIYLAHLLCPLIEYLNCFYWSLEVAVDILIIL